MGSVREPVNSDGIVTGGLHEVARFIGPPFIASR